MMMDFCGAADIWTVVLILVVTNIVVLLTMLMNTYRGASGVVRDTCNASATSGHIHHAQIQHNKVKWNKKKGKIPRKYTGCGHVVYN